MAETLIRRHWYMPDCTQGIFFVQDPDSLRMICYTLEDQVRGEGEAKVYGRTAIPTGRFLLTVDYSTRFKKYMFHVMDVPGFDGVRVHAGNKAEDTLGCPLVGNIRGQCTVLESKAALTILYSELTVSDGWDPARNCMKLRMKEETWITIENGQPLDGSANPNSGPGHP